MVREFDRKFRLKFNTTKCGELLNCDLNTDEGKKYFKENNLTDEVCAKCVEGAISIVKQMI